ncbi:MAG: hypothetical protein U5K56_09890 [Halioglobus sp.]|nr:hypothetical protein [Halioglobus sp.]
MKKLLHALQTEKAESPSEELESQFRSIEFERELMQAKRLEYEGYRQRKNAQISLVNHFHSSSGTSYISKRNKLGSQNRTYCHLELVGTFRYWCIEFTRRLLRLFKAANRKREQEELMKRLHATIRELESYHER